MSHDGCADWSATLGEPLGGSGPVTDRWLLIEEPGPWGERGLPDSGIDPAVAAMLTRRAERAGARVQLIRRPDRDTGTDRRVFFASSRPGRTWLAERLLEPDDTRLTELDLDALAAAPTAPRKGGWEPVDGPLFLVCTHAKRDPCCALYGRAAAAVVARSHGDRLWETSHTGGHRFAPNLICLPAGLAFGRLDPDGVTVAADAYAAGEIQPEGYRGRSSHDRFTQAADAAVRRRAGRLLVDAVALDHVAGGGERRVVHLRTPSGPARVEVLARPTGTTRLIGCHKTGATDPGEHIPVTVTLPTGLGAR